MSAMIRELEQQCGGILVDRRHGAREMEARLAVDGELELLLGIGSSARDRFADGGIESARVRENVGRRMPDRELHEQFPGARGSGRTATRSGGSASSGG